MASTSAWATSSDMAHLRMLILLALAFPAWGADQEAEITRFLGETFAKPPAAETLWLAACLTSTIKKS